MPFDGFLNDDAIRAKAPSVFATHAAAGVSDKYAYLPTYQAVRDMRLMGLEVVSVREGFKRSVEGRNYAIHELRMRRPGDVSQGRELGDLFPEAILRNSHDRSSNYSLGAGIHRLVCKNGMTVADHAFTVNLRHIGRNQADKLHAGVQMIMGNLPKVLDIANEWNGIKLSSYQMFDFAKKATELRGTSIAIDPMQVLHRRRWNDEGDSLWSVFNRVQENFTKGGLRGRGTNGQRRAISGIRTLSADVDFNKKLWTAASELAAEVKGVSVAFA